MVPRILAAAVLVGAPGGPAPPAEAAATCAGRAVTIQGTDRGERIDGTPRADVIDARDGDDVVNGLGGDDVICGGEGADDLRGQGGNDRLLGGLDGVRTERVHGDSCSREPAGYCLETWLAGDALRGGPGDDLLVPGWDTRHGHRESGTGMSFPQWPPSLRSLPTNTRDVLRWDAAPRGVRVNLTQQRATGEGTDTIVSSGLVRVVGSSYDDVVVGSTRDDDLRVGSGSDQVYARDGDDYVQLDGEGSTWRDADRARGGPGEDYLHAGTGPDELLGEDGADLLLDEGVPRADRLHGGGGDDVVADVLVALPGQVADGGAQPGDEFWPRLQVGGDATWDMTTGVMTFTEPDPTTTRATGFHAFRYAATYATSWTVGGTPGVDTVAAPGRFDGGAGDDRYAGGPAPDTFDGGAGDDRYDDDPGVDNICTSVEQDPQGRCASNTP